MCMNIFLYNNININSYYISIIINTLTSPAVHLRFLATYRTASLIDSVSHESLNFVTSDDAKRLLILLVP